VPCNRRAKYCHKCIVEYIDIGGASCPGIGGPNTFINYVLEYFYNKWAS
jgi:hypothetical protein